MNKYLHRIEQVYGPDAAVITQPIQAPHKFEDFDSMFWKCPKTYFKLLGKNIELPRQTLSFGKDWAAPSVAEATTEIPDILQPFIDLAKEDYPDENFEHVQVIRYRTGKDYIGFHSDKGAPKLIITFSLYKYTHGTPRELTICSKKDKSFSRTIAMPNLSMVTMKGRNMQKLFKHAVLPSKTSNPRISIILRAF